MFVCEWARGAEGGGWRAGEKTVRLGGVGGRGWGGEEGATQFISATRLFIMLYYYYLGAPRLYLQYVPCNMLCYIKGPPRLYLQCIPGYVLYYIISLLPGGTQIVSAVYSRLYII